MIQKTNSTSNVSPNMPQWSDLTLRDLWRYGLSAYHQHELFCGHGFLDATDEVSYLLLHSLKLPLDKLEPYLNAKATINEVEQFFHLLNQRIETRKPLPYLTKESWLQGYSFYIDDRAIVPRSYIAEMIAGQFQPWISDVSKVKRILDVCTGSGCLAILLAEHFPQAIVEAVDIDPQALEVAKINVERFGLQDRVILHEGDLFAPLKKGKEHRFDLIISNPPYVNTQAMNTLPQEYLHEPQLALAGGDDGMTIVREIFNQSKPFMKSNTLMFIEIGNEKHYVDTVFPDMDLTWIATQNRDDAVFMVDRNAL
jgi:ribosomal protein L3 glutamine methyltransferase